MLFQLLMATQPPVVSTKLERTEFTMADTQQLLGFVLRNPVHTITNFLKTVINEDLDPESVQFNAFRESALTDFKKMKDTDVEFQKAFASLGEFVQCARSSIHHSLAAKLANSNLRVKNIAPDETLTIIPAEPKHFEQIWPIFHAVVSRGDTFYYSPDTSKEEAYHKWMETPSKPYVAFLEGQIAGTYMIVPNYSGLGSHISNAGYMVSPHFRNKGIGRKLAEHSFEEAKKQGYQGMRFNMVVSTNQAAVHLWQSVGMQIVGIAPQSFKHPDYGPVATYVMFKNFYDQLTTREIRHAFSGSTEAISTNDVIDCSQSSGNSSLTSLVSSELSDHA